MSQSEVETLLAFDAPHGTAAEMERCATRLLTDEALTSAVASLARARFAGYAVYSKQYVFGVQADFNAFWDLPFPGPYVMLQFICSRAEKRMGNALMALLIRQLAAALPPPETQPNAMTFLVSSALTDAVPFHRRNGFRFLTCRESARLNAREPDELTAAWDELVAPLDARRTPKKYRNAVAKYVRIAAKTAHILRRYTEDQREPKKNNNGYYMVRVVRHADVNYE